MSLRSNGPDAGRRFHLRTYPWGGGVKASFVLAAEHTVRSIVSLYLAGFFLVAGCLPANPRFRSVATTPGTDEEKLIEAIIRRAVVEAKDIPDYRLLRGKRRLYLIDHRVPYGVFDPTGPVDTNRVTFAPQFPNLEIVLASAKQMQQIANARGGFPYLALGSIDISGDSAIVELAIEHAQSEESKGKVLLLSGGGYRLAFVKEEGEWVYLPGRGSYWMY